MKIRKFAISLITASMLSSTLFAGGDILPVVTPVEPEPVPVSLTQMFYVGVGLVASGLSRDCACSTTTSSRRLKDMTYGGILRAGMNYNDYIGLEVRYINASIENDFSEMEHYGIFLRPQYPLTPQANIYGLLGYGKTTVDYAAGKRDSTLSESGFTYGAGLEFAMTREISVWLDAQHILSDEGTFNTDLNLGTMGVAYNF